MAGDRRTSEDSERLARDAAIQGHLRDFGLHLRRLRQERGMSQERLAHAAGLHRAVVGFIERAEREVGIGTLWPLAEALGIEVADLFKPSQPVS